MPRTWGPILLSAGWAGECLECPLHGYQFDVDGNCVNAPESTHGSPRAVLRRLSCRERYGMVFAFLGETPTFDIPPNRRKCQRSLPAARRWSLHFDVSHYVFGLNPFRCPPLRQRVHNRRFVSYPGHHYRLAEQAEHRLRGRDHSSSLGGLPDVDAQPEEHSRDYRLLGREFSGYDQSGYGIRLRYLRRAPWVENRTRLYISGVMPRAAGRWPGQAGLATPLP